MAKTNQARAARSPANPLATLESRATPASATAASNKRLPTGKALTGQYLYDQFCTPNKTELTKMMVVESWASSEPGHGVAVEVFDKACKDMVEMAEKAGDAAKKTAQNAASALRAIYGAIRFAPSQLRKAGYEAGKTGFHQSRVIAASVLKEAGIHWRGVRVDSPEEKARKADNKTTKAALEQAQKENPQQATESYADWMTRCLAEADAIKAQGSLELRVEEVKKLAEKVEKLCGEHLADVLAYITDRHAAIVTEGEERQPEGE